MTKMRVTPDEWWPVYTPDADYGDEIDVSPEEAARIDAAFAEFNAVQDLIRSRLPKDHTP